MTFQEYCESKKIDPVAFQKGNPEHYGELEAIFNEVSPASFTQQKKFLINSIRRAYQLKITEVIKEKTAVKKPGIKIPGIKPKVAIPGSSKPNIPGAKPVLKPKIGGAAKPVIKAKTEDGAKPVMKPKIPGVTKSATPKPKIPGISKPVIKPVIKAGGQPKPAALKPKIPGAKKPSALKPKIPGAKPASQETESTEEKPKVAALKPKIPGIKKPSALKPKIPGVKK